MADERKQNRRRSVGAGASTLAAAHDRNGFAVSGLTSTPTIFAHGWRQVRHA